MSPLRAVAQGWRGEYFALRCINCSRRLEEFWKQRLNANAAANDTLRRLTEGRNLSHTRLRFRQIITLVIFMFHETTTHSSDFEMKKRVTLSDVAEAAGVALGTASRVLNNVTDVDPTTRQRVLQTVEKMQYVPLRVRRSKDGSRGHGTKSQSIGMILLGMDDSLVHVPVLTEIRHGVELAATNMNINLLVANLPNADRIPGFLKHNLVEGLIVKISQYNELPDPERHPLIRSLFRFPIVWAWAKPFGAPGDLCSFNHESAAHMAADCMLAHGHRRVGFLNPKMGKSSLEHIKSEFRYACESRGLSLSVFESASTHVAKWPEPALSSTEETLPLVDQWKAMSDSTRPSALFVPADNIAVYLYAALEQRGIQIPRDVSVIGCNNESSLSRWFKPSLTTMSVNATRIGNACVTRLLSRLRNPGDQTEQATLFEPVLVTGESMARVEFEVLTPQLSTPAARRRGMAAPSDIDHRLEPYISAP